ncbi:MAG: hypothetical protein ACJ71T_01655 [Actinomycetales bacterium]
MPSRSRGPLAAVAALLLAGVGLLVAAAPAHALIPTSVDKNLWGVNGRVRAIVQTPDAIYIGGKFTALVGPNGATLPRLDLAALDPTTGQPLDWAPPVNNIVWGLAVSPDGSTVYAGGQFTKVGITGRAHVAAFDAATGALQSFNPKVDGTVEAILPTATTVYLGGTFTTVGTTARTDLAAVTTAGLVVPGFVSNANNTVHALAMTPGGSKLVVGGLFDTLNGVTGSKRLDLVDPATGAVTVFVEKVAYEVFGVTATPSQVFAAAAGGGGHTYAYSVSTLHQQWLAISDGDSHQVAVQNGVLYVGGHFTVFSGQPASHLTAISPTTGQQVGFLIKVNSNLGIFAMSSFQGHLAIGGDFTKINRLNEQHVARFSENVDLSAPTQPGRPAGTATSSTTATVTWDASTDDQVRDVVYNVYRDGGSTPVGQVTSSSTTTVSFNDSGMSPGSTHTWTVQASDGSNPSPMSDVSDPVTLTNLGYPALEGVSMSDRDSDGRVDQVVLTFSENVSCHDPCLSPWTLSNVPSGGTLQSVSASAGTVTLGLLEGAGAPDTSAGSFTVALANDPVNGVVGGGGAAARFAATAPADAAPPVPVGLSSTPGAQPGVMEPGDTFTVSFSEPIAPGSVHAANVKELDQNGAGNDEVIVVGLSDGAINLGSNDYVTQPGGTVVFATSTLTMANGNVSIVSTISGLCTGTACGMTGTPVASPIGFRPEPALTDASGNHATGSYTATLLAY